MLAREIPVGYTLTFKESLFNTDHHRQSQSNTNWVSFYWLDEKKKQIHASWHLNVVEDQALSPYRATFGGVDFSANLPLRQLSQFVNESSRLLEREVAEIKVVLPPQNYDNIKFIKAYQTFSDVGYKVSLSEMVAAIPVTNDPFESNIHSSELKKLKRAKKEGYVFKKLSADKLTDVYELVAKCREERGIQLSLSLVQLILIINYQPEHFHYYAVVDDKKMIAAAICIQVTEDVLYVFYGGHLKAYDKTSPAVMLYQGIYKDCQTQEFTLLDFGTSPAETGTNHDLLDFKKYLGSELGLKVTFIKHNG